MVSKRSFSWKVECAKMQAMTSDVLVLGGGGAALVAAISAAEAGASVSLVSKGPPGLLSCTAYAGGGFTAAVEGLSSRRHRDLTMETGRGINDEGLVSVMAEEGASALSWLEDRGVDLEYRRDGASMAGKNLGKLVKGTAMTMPLVRRCRELGVQIHHPVTVYALRGKGFGGPVTGAVGRDAEGVDLEFAANSVVLATGGGAWTFARTDNPRGLAGDGYLMAFAAGCSLRDMEFVQFYPLGPGPDVSRTWYMDARILDRVRLTDGNGEDFLSPLLEQWGLSSGREINMFARDRLSRAIAQKRRETGDVYLHLEDLPAEDRRDPRLAHRARLMAGPHRDDPWTTVSVAPVSHFMCGGVVVDEFGATEVTGLWACGEVAGGVHGANRVGGNALTELTVFGIRSGRAAADAARAGDAPVPGDPALLPRGICVEGATVSGEVHQDRFRARAYDMIGPYRTPESMREFIAEASRLLRPRDFAGSSPVQRALHWTGLSVGLAALAREESRGNHFREDYPEEDDAWKGALTVVPELQGDILLPRIREKTPREA